MKLHCPNDNDPLILNVDDDEAARYIRTRILQNAGYKVAEASNGMDALSLAKTLKPSLILLDVKLPDINGFEVCRQIKTDPATRRIMVLQMSATFVSASHKIRGLDGGADNYLAPPADSDELVANVKALLRLRQTQSDLHDSEERLRQLTDNIEDVLWLFGLFSDEMLYVNKAYEKVWGRPAVQLEQSPTDWMQTILASDRENVEAGWRSLLLGGHYDEEYRLSNPDGSLRWIRDRAFVVRDKSDTPYRLARLSSDITLRKLMESNLQHADRKKNEFLAVLADELRGPLSAIVSAVALMDAADADQPQVHQQARHAIERHVRHLTRLVDELLDAARIAEDKMTLELQAVELGALMRLALNAEKPILETSGHRIVVDFPSEPVWLNGDPVRLVQIIRSLLHNAGKFTDAGGDLQLEAIVVGESMVRITVRDNGIGMSSETLPHIFEMFSRGPSARNAIPDGLGIGLSVVSTLVQMHGGRIIAESPGVGQGSIFVIELPCRSDAP